MSERRGESGALKKRQGRKDRRGMVFQAWFQGASLLGTVLMEGIRLRLC